MRQLKRHESEKLFQKLAKYLGEQTSAIHERDGEKWVFRVHKKKIFFLRAKLEKYIAQISKKNLISAGCCIARITHNNNIRIIITALPVLAAHATTKFWVKPNQEQGFMYGNNVTRNGLGRISDTAMQHQGCVVYSMGDIPIGFGVTAQSTAQCRKSENNSIVLFHEADVGEYVRNEDGL